MSIYNIRASSWGSLFDCAHKWEGVHLLGMKKPSGPRALLGSAWHASTAAFDNSRINGDGLTSDDTAGIVSDTINKPPYEIDWTSDELSAKDAEKIAINLHGIYCNDWSPKYNFVSVEMETKPFQIDCGGDLSIQLTGTMDRSRIKKGHDGAGIADLKSGGNAVQKGAAKTKGHAAQVGTYELLFEHTTGLYITQDAEIIGAKTKGKPEIASGTIKNSKQLLIGTDTQKGLIEYAAEMFRAGLFPPNPQSHLCNPKYCARWDTCIFHD